MQTRVLLDRLRQVAAVRAVRQLIGDASFLRGLKPEDYTDERFGVPTVRDILKELEKPGRDPRPGLETAAFQEGVETLADLKLGMVLEGVITNVTNFGAVVDIGVHQDGLVHISAMSDKFVKDPRDVVKAGQVVKVKVMEIDLERRRAGLSLRLSDEPGEATPKREPRRADGRRQARPARHEPDPEGRGAFAAAFAKARKK